MLKKRSRIALFLLAFSALIIVIAVLIARRNSSVPDITTHEPKAATPADVSRPYEHRIAPDRETVQNDTIPQIEWSLYIGGDEWDLVFDMEGDEDNNIYLAGGTPSANLFGRINEFNTINDGFVTKMSHAGYVVWALYIGGSDGDFCIGISVRDDGAVYVAGRSISPDLPGRTNDKKGSYDLFVSRISDQGQIVWTTYVGGEESERGGKILVADDGKIYIVGTTNSTRLDKRLNEYGGARMDGFVAQLDISGELHWTRYFGMQDREHHGIAERIPRISISNMALADNGDVIIVGHTNAIDLPDKTNDFHGGANDAFVARLSPDGEFLWTTYVGGEGEDIGSDLALDSAGNIFICGMISSHLYYKRHDDELMDKATGDLPSALNLPFGPKDAFVTKLTGDGEIVWSKYIGGRSIDNAYSIALDSNDNIYIGGITESIDISKRINDFYGVQDAFIANFTPEGDHKWSYYIGGEMSERGPVRILLKESILYLTAGTESRELPNRLNEIHFKIGRERPLPNVFVARIRLPIDAEAKVDRINDGDGAE